LGGDSKVEAFFKFLVVSNAKNVTILIFPRKGEMFDKSPDAMHFYGTSAGVDKNVKSGKS
jgi:hypothetical protein